MASIDFADLARKLWPYLSGYVGQLSNGSSVITAAASSTSTSASAPGYASFLTLAADADLSAERVFTLATNSGLSGTDAGAGAAYTLTLGTPSTLTVSTTNALSGSNHSHAITSSSSPGAAASLLASNASGVLTLVQLTATTRLRSPILDTASGDLSLSPATGITTASQLTATTRVRTPIVDTASGDLSLSPATGTTTATRITLSDKVRTPTIDTASGDLALSPATGITTASQLTASTKVRTPLIDTASGDLTLSPATANTAASRITLSDRLRTPTIDTASGDLSLTPSGKVILTTGKSLEGTGYASQTTSFAITQAGEADFRYLFTDELHAKSFIADLEQALAGGQIIAKSVAVLYANFTMPASGASGTFIVRDLPSATGMRVFEDRDIIRFRSFNRSAGSLTIADAWGAVVLDTTYGTSGFDSATKTQRYTFIRHAGITIDDTNNDPITDGSADADPTIRANNVTTPEGNMAAGTTIYADSIVLDYGKNKSGIHEINAIDGAYGLNSPYAQTASWVLHPKNATVRTRVGNLRGITGVADEYGLYAGTGTANADQYIRVSDAGVILNNVPLKLFSGSNQRVNIDQDGVDVWFSSNGGTTKQLSWTGSTLSVVGNITITGGSGWSNLSDIPSTLQAPSGTGLFLSSTQMGFYTGSQWRTYIDNAGKFEFRNAPSASAAVSGLRWNPDGGGTGVGRLEGGTYAANATPYAGAFTTQWYTDTTGAIVAGGGAVKLNASGIFGVDGSGKPAFTLTSATTTVNGESFLAGDTMMGDNSSGKANLYWKNSSGALDIRVGQTSKFKIDSTGAITAGAVGSTVAGFTVYSGGVNIQGTYLQMNFDSGSSSLKALGGDCLIECTSGRLTLKSNGNYIKALDGLGCKVDPDGTYALKVGGNMSINAPSSTYNPYIDLVSAGGTFQIYSYYVNSDLYFYAGGANRFQFTAGGVPYNSSGNASWGTISDARLKIVDEQYTAGLSTILAIKPVVYRYTGEHGTNNDGEKRVGVLAQEIRAIMPETVTEDEDGYLRFNPSNVMYAMINAIKDLHAEMENLKRNAA